MNAPVPSLKDLINGSTALHSISAAIPHDYIDTVAGSGKTVHGRGRAIRLAQDREKVLFVQPTNDLNGETYLNLTAQAPHVRVTMLNTTTHRGRVVSEIERHLLRTGQGGEIVLITHEAFDLVGHWPCRRNWHVICDEPPNAFLFHNINVSDTHGIITDHLIATPHDETHSTLSIKDSDAVKRLSENKNDDELIAKLRMLAKTLLNPRYETYVVTDAYNELIPTEREEAAMLTAFSLRQLSSFEGFKSVLFMGAFFEQSFFHVLMKAQGARFLNITGRYPKLARYHTNGSLITIHHAFERDWSKNQITTHRNEAEAFVEAAETVMNGEWFAWMTNVKKDGFVPIRCTRGDELPNSPHGLNGYLDIHNVIVLSALRSSPALDGFLMWCGMTKEQIRTAFTYHPIYQALTRSSARVVGDENPKTFVVPDRSTAEWLADVFQGARMLPLSLSVVEQPERKRGRPRLYANDAERKAAQRAREKNSPP